MPLAGSSFSVQVHERLELVSSPTMFLQVSNWDGSGDPFSLSFLYPMSRSVKLVYS